MSNYRRSQQKGGSFFFTVALANRQSHLLIQYIDYFKQAYCKVWQNYPFESVAVCVLPDHVHAILMSAKHAATAKSSIEKKAFGNADFGNMKSVMSKIYSVV